MNLTRRQANLAGFAACVAALCVALFAQYGLGLTPCHLCIFQRVCVAGLGVAFLLATLHNPGDLGARVYAGLIGLCAATTAVVAGRHVWIQLQPPGSVPGCGADLSFMLDVLPVMQVIIKVFKAGGECQKIDWSFLGISIPGYVLIFAILMLGWAVWANTRLRRA
ncbi:MAG: disulfide bond formation protein B [Steroidobacteraceae bacterium]|nr:disulfide bond formation protein B [Steroidobacteraceae bacterium]